MGRFKKIVYILLLISFIIIFPLIGWYKSNVVLKLQGDQPTMAGAIIMIGWMWRSAAGLLMTFMIMVTNKLKITRASKYLTILMAVVINIAFMFIIDDFWFFMAPFFQYLWIGTNLTVLIPIIVDKRIAAKISEVNDEDLKL